MNCDYCGKNMPKSYSYEVGGVVDCGCRFKKKKDPNNIETSKLSVALDKANKRIAELEHSIDVLQTTAKHINSEFFETAIKYLESELSNRKSVNTTIDNPQS